MTISVCIPTYNRSADLAGAIMSCMDQTLLPDEILVGDDSTDDETKTWIGDFKAELPVAIKYYRNTPSFGQSKNIRTLFEKVTTDHLVLLHDDDRLLPDALEKLHHCFTRFPNIDVAYGKQYYMDDEGKIDFEFSKEVNTKFFRDTRYEGTKLSSLEAGFLQQIPSDGYMLKTKVLEKANYNEQLKDAGDFEFGLQLGLHSFKMFFLNEYISKYKWSNNSNRTKKDNDAAITAYSLVDNIEVPYSSEKLKSAWLKSRAPAAIAQASKLGMGKTAFQIFVSKYHYQKILSLGGLNRLLMIFKAFIR